MAVGWWDRRLLSAPEAPSSLATGSSPDSTRPMNSAGFPASSSGFMPGSRIISEVAE
jgi:hypothetical protein